MAQTEQSIIIGCSGDGFFATNFHSFSSQLFRSALVCTGDAAAITNPKHHTSAPAHSVLILSFSSSTLQQKVLRQSHQRQKKCSLTQNGSSVFHPNHLADARDTIIIIIIEADRLSAVLAAEQPKSSLTCSIHVNSNKACCSPLSDDDNHHSLHSSSSSGLARQV